MVLIRKWLSSKERTGTSMARQPEVVPKFAAAQFSKSVRREISKQFTTFSLGVVTAQRVYFSLRMEPISERRLLAGKPIGGLYSAHIRKGLSQFTHLPATKTVREESFPKLVLYKALTGCSMEQQPEEERTRTEPSSR